MRDLWGLFVRENAWAPLAKVSQVGCLHLEIRRFLSIRDRLYIKIRWDLSLGDPHNAVHLVNVLRSFAGLGESQCAVCICFNRNATWPNLDRFGPIWLMVHVFFYAREPWGV